MRSVVEVERQIQDQGTGADPKQPEQPPRQRSCTSLLGLHATAAATNATTTGTDHAFIDHKAPTVNAAAPPSAVVAHRPGDATRHSMEHEPTGEDGERHRYDVRV